MKLEKPPKNKGNGWGDIANLVLDYNNKENNQFFNDNDRHYRYWSDFKHLKNLPLETSEKSWFLLKFHRNWKSKKLKIGHSNFRYFITDYLQKQFHEFDIKVLGKLYENPITDLEEKQFLNNSLYNEAVASSQIEGAATTTDVAFDMLKKGRNPRNESEQMILNNLQAIQFIKSQSNNDLNKALIIELHQIMTANTEAEKYAGDYRDKEIYVQDYIDGEIVHNPPDSQQLEKYMGDLIKFANSDSIFIHPIAKASIIHFLVGYIHPFGDGNGRTARALFYWYMWKKGYHFIKNISISKAIIETRRQYDKAFLQTEYDDHDLNYFIIYSMKSLERAFKNLLDYRSKKATEKAAFKSMVYDLSQAGLSNRQAESVSYLYVKSKYHITINDYAGLHEIVRQTANKDLMELVKLGLLKKEKKGKSYYFMLVSKQAVDGFLNR